MFKARPEAPTLEYELELQNSIVDADMLRRSVFNMKEHQLNQGDHRKANRFESIMDMLTLIHGNLQAIENQHD